MATRAADAMGLTADRLQKLNLVDEVLREPLGGAHRKPEVMAEELKTALIRNFDELERMSVDELLARRDQRLAGFGIFSESK